LGAKLYQVFVFVELGNVFFVLGKVQSIVKGCLGESPTQGQSQAKE
jgi:hypothetical protein